VIDRLRRRCVGALAWLLAPEYLVWTTAAGNSIPVDCMADEHLKNTCRQIEAMLPAWAAMRREIARRAGRRRRRPATIEIGIDP
jgi:hypothetical protein